MILVAVSQHNASYLLFVLFKICEIGYNKVNAEHIVIGERKTAVDDEYIVTALIYIDILAYFVYAAERHNPDRRFSALL